MQKARRHVLNDATDLS